MVEVIELQGTDKKLYELVAPLVMNPKVLKRNYNYPFRTSEDFCWFVALEDNTVVGFIPLEHRGMEYIINNYYIEQEDSDTLHILLNAVITAAKDEDYALSAVAFTKDSLVFKEFGFNEIKAWTRYVKMKR